MNDNDNTTMAINITNSYNAGAIAAFSATSSTYRGGIIGRASALTSANVHDVYYRSDCGPTVAIGTQAGADDSTIATSETEANMKLAPFVTALNSTAFRQDTEGTLNSYYPYLVNEVKFNVALDTNANGSSANDITFTVKQDETVASSTSGSLTNAGGTLTYILDSLQYTWTASKPGYETQSGSFSGEDYAFATISVVLPAIRYEHAFTVTPADASFALTDTGNGNAPIAPSSVSEGVYTYGLLNGSYAWAASRYGYTPASGSVTVSYPEPTPVAIPATLVALPSYDIAFILTPSANSSFASGDPRLTVTYGNEVVYTGSGMSQTAHLAVGNNYHYRIEATGFVFQEADFDVAAATSIPLTIQEVPPWDGTADTSWYEGHESDASYTLFDAADLAGVASLVNTSTADFEGKTLTLANNIDLAGEDWTPIGVPSQTYNVPHLRFRGTFDGAGHTVGGLFINTTLTEADAAKSYQALFAVVDGATIKDLTVTGAVTVTGNFSTYVSWVTYVAGIVARASYIANVSGTGGVTMTDCVNKVDVSVKSTDNKAARMLVAGVMVSADNENPAQAILTRCYNYGTISTQGVDSYSSVAGITVGSRSTLLISDCANYGDITARGELNSISGDAVEAVGIVSTPGTNNATSKLERCVNYGNITATGPAAGIVYRGGALDCINTGTIRSDLAMSVTNDSFYGAAAGIVCNGSAEGCYNSGAVYGKVCAGGITSAGGIGGALIENCLNTGAVVVSGTTTSYGGGLLGTYYQGNIANPGALRLKNNLNLGAVSAVGTAYLGALVGWQPLTMSSSDVTNNYYYVDGRALSPTGASFRADLLPAADVPLKAFGRGVKDGTSPPDFSGQDLTGQGVLTTPEALCTTLATALGAGFTSDTEGLYGPAGWPVLTSVATPSTSSPLAKHNRIEISVVAEGSSNEVPLGLSLVVRDSKGQEVVPSADGSWNLPAGSYTWTACAPGYVTKQNPFYATVAPRLLALELTLAAVDGITLSHSSLGLVTGSSFTLIATVSPQDALEREVTWTSGDPLVVAVNNGVLTALAPGSATITATTVKGGFSAVCAVEVVPFVVPPAISAATLPVAKAGQPYSHTLAAMGTSPLTWAVASGALPAGLSLDATNGTIFGTAMRVQDASFSVTATNSAGAHTQAFTLAVVREGDASWQRLAGEHRYATMAAISQSGFTSANVVFLTTGENFPDALCASGLAGLNEAPIVLTTPSALSSHAASEIARLAPKLIYILGDPKAVSQEIEDKLKGQGYKTERLAGADRYATALAIYAKGTGFWSKTAIVTTGRSPNGFADALSIASWAWASRSPVFLVNNAGLLDAATQAAILSGGFGDVLILGDTVSVSADITSQLGSGYSYTRLGGIDRYETSMLIAQWVLDQGTLDVGSMAVTRGDNFPDALAAGALCGKLGSVLLLVKDQATAHTGIDKIIATHKARIVQGFILGDDKSVSDALAQKVIGASR
jgi:putative cell wall-binding protein